MTRGDWWLMVLASGTGFMLAEFLRDWFYAIFERMRHRDH